MRLHESTLNPILRARSIFDLYLLIFDLPIVTIKIVFVEVVVFVDWADRGEHGAHHIAVLGVGVSELFAKERVLVQGIENELHRSCGFYFIRRLGVLRNNGLESFNLLQCLFVVGKAKVVVEPELIALGKPANDILVW